MNREHIKYAIIGIAIILSAYLLGRAYTYKYRSQDTVVVTGLGETEFESDLIVWSGVLTAEAAEAADGYRRIEQSKRKVSDYLAAKGIDAKQVVWNFVNVDKTYQTVYSANGNYAGQRFTGYSLRQEFSIESTDVDLVENVSREISALIAQGVSIEARQPDYYYTKLDDVKLSLIERASADARARAEKIAQNAGTGIGAVASARMGVFQITGANANEEFSAGGSFNTASRHKKARITCASSIGSNSAAMNLSERILRIATSHWTERSCFALTLAAALTGDGRMWIAAGTAVALTVGAIVAGSIAPLREARHAARDFPHTPEYEAYARRRAANEADDRHRIELK